jgi:hypothetical protein
MQFPSDLLMCDHSVSDHSDPVSDYSQCRLMISVSDWLISDLWWYHAFIVTFSRSWSTLSLPCLHFLEYLWSLMVHSTVVSFGVYQVSEWCLMFCCYYTVITVPFIDGLCTLMFYYLFFICSILMLRLSHSVLWYLVHFVEVHWVVLFSTNLSIILLAWLTHWLFSIRDILFSEMMTQYIWLLFIQCNLFVTWLTVDISIQSLFDEVLMTILRVMMTTVVDTFLCTVIFVSHCVTIDDPVFDDDTFGSTVRYSTVYSWWWYLLTDYDDTELSLIHSHWWWPLPLWLFWLSDICSDDMFLILFFW